MLDASVVFKWFTDDEERDKEAARALEAEYRVGEVLVTAPYLLFLELINIAARRRAWPAERLMEMARALLESQFTIRHPPLDRVAYWASRGLTVYDACYVALAEERRTVVVTADERILTVAGPLAEALAPPAAQEYQTPT